MEGMRWRGQWNPYITYEIGDVVSFYDYMFICVRENATGYIPYSYRSGFERMGVYSVDVMDGGEF